MGENGTRRTQRLAENRIYGSLRSVVSGVLRWFSASRALLGLGFRSGGGSFRLDFACWITNQVLQTLERRDLAEMKGAIDQG